MNGKYKWEDKRKDRRRKGKEEDEAKIEKADLLGKQAHFGEGAEVERRQIETAWLFPLYIAKDLEYQENDEQSES